MLFFLLSNDIALLRHVDTVKELSDILVSNLAALLDIRRALGDILNGVAAKDKLILLSLGNFDIDARAHDHPADDFLANEVPDLHFGAASLLVLLEVDVDGEMGVDVSELVEVALGDTDDEVVKERPHGSESGNIFPGAVVDKNGEGVGLGLGEGDRDVAQVLGKLSSGTLDRDKPRLDVDLDPLGDFKELLRLDILHPGGVSSIALLKNWVSFAG